MLKEKLKQSKIIYSSYKTATHIFQFIELIIIYLYYLVVKFRGLERNTNSNEKIIVSLTTMPKRIVSASIVISILMNQTKKPNKILLYLSHEEFDNKKIPLLLKKACKNGLEIIYCENIKSHKKYYYTMLNFPNDIIITVDDDLFYKKKLIEELYNSYLKNPKAISANNVHKIIFKDDESILPYEQWKDVNEIGSISFDNLAVGVGGVLYPPHSLHKEFSNLDSIKENCFNADDLWLKVMELLNNFPVVKSGTIKFNYIPFSQEIALFQSNCFESKNDIQFQKLVKKYNHFYGEKDSLLKRIQQEIKL